MNLPLSKRVSTVKPSATMAVNEKAGAMKKQGINIINLSVGEPDFPTPDPIKQAAIAAINNNITRYAPADGMPDLKAAVAQKLKRDNQLEYDPSEIIITCGAKQAVYNAMQAIINAGDEVIIPAPYWVSYTAMTQLAEGIPVIVKAHHDQNFKISPEQLEAAITDKTRAFILNSPSNPTGMIYHSDELKALGEILRNHPNIVIIADDIYEYISWDKQAFSSLLNACPHLADRTILINGVSKAYAMTGWRVGYSAAPVHFTKPMKTIQSHSTSCTSSISQVAAITALAMPYADLKPMYDAFHRRHDILVAGLRQIQGISVCDAHGAFYVYPYVQPIIDKLGLKDDIEFANHLLQEAHIATVPGTAFGTPGYLRISCAVSDGDIQETISRLQKLL